jgi:SnoaL-like protein
MTDARRLVEGYFEAWKHNDFADMRSALDEHVHFIGPIDTFDTADVFLQSIQGLSHIKDDLVIMKIWAEGQDVLVWYDLHTKVAPPAPVAEWHRTSNGKVTAIRAVFDARPFAKPAAS